MRKNFKRSCDQVLFRRALSKNYHNNEVALIKMPFLIIGSKLKNKNEKMEYQVYSGLFRSTRVSFLLVWVMEFNDTSNMTILNDVRRSHENGK